MSGSTSKTGAHPRSRGEHANPSASTDAMMGSSPLTRGAPQIPVGGDQQAGLIPAHAGSTACFSTPVSGGGAHPRSRGEHLPRNITSLATSGSSPLTRGALSGGKCCELHYPAHPRSRGEHGVLLFDHVDHRGSSPLTRGALRDEEDTVHAHRLIPAHAGSTPWAR